MYTLTAGKSTVITLRAGSGKILTVQRGGAGELSFGPGPQAGRSELLGSSVITHGPFTRGDATIYMTATSDLVYSVDTAAGLLAATQGTAFKIADGAVVFDASTNPAMVKSGGGGGVGTQTVSPFNWIPGSKAIRLTNTSGAGGLIRWTLTQTIFPANTFLSAPNMVCPVLFENFADLNVFSIDLSFVDATFTTFSRISWGIGSGGSGKFKQNGWQLVNGAPGSWSDTGTVDWTTQCFALRFNFTNGAVSASSIIHVDDIVFNRRAKAKFLYVLDFPYTSAYTIVRPMLNARGLKATYAVTPDALGGGGVMTYEQCLQVVADGHALALRPSMDFATHTVQECVDFVAAAQAQMIQLFGEVGRIAGRHIIYSQGHYWPGSGGTTNAIGDMTVVNRLRYELGVLTGRNTETTGAADVISLGMPGADGPAPWLNCHGIIGFFGGNTTATISAAIDNAIAASRAIVYFQHTVLPGNTDASDPTSQATIFDYLVTNKANIDVITYPQLAETI